MENLYDDKQLSRPPQEASRVDHLRAWMVLHKVTFVALGEQLGITGSAAQLLMKGERMAVRRHGQLVALGVPEELLPPAVDIPIGRPRKPGLPAHL